MIKSNELRIGNYILFDDGKQDKITAIWEDGVNGNSHSRWYLERIMPIALTGEWLEKLGFQKDDDKGESRGEEIGDVFRHQCFSVINVATKFHLWNYNDEDNWYSYASLNEINSVHELQNLYFALTGEELTVKEMA